MAGEALEPEKPPRVAPRLKAAPKIRQIYWCDFWQDAQLPEMWKTRPVIIISGNNTLHGVCTVVPFSTEPENAKNPWGLPYTLPDGATFAICNHIYTVAVSRLSPHRD